LVARASSSESVSGSSDLRLDGHVDHAAVIATFDL
jgi:hypothetical protein